jgi:hypothetical protein
MFQPRRWMVYGVLLTFACLAGHSNAAWTITDPATGATVDNDEDIDTKGDKTNGAVANVTLEKLVNQVWTKVDGPRVDVTPRTTWEVTFPVPTGNWLNGDYRTHLKNMGEGIDMTQAFTVANP